MVVAAVIVVVVTHGRGNDTVHDRGRSTFSAVHMGCPTDVDQHKPINAPPDGITWKVLSAKHPVALPDGGHRYGPCQPTSTSASGYAHTPAGALIAASQIGLRVALPDTARDTITRQVEPGPNTDKLLASAEDDSDPTSVPTFAAYAINSYTSSAAEISLAMTYEVMDGYMVFRETVEWHDGDWKLIAPVGGSWSAQVSHLVTLDGFVSWGPQ